MGGPSLRQWLIDYIGHAFRSVSLGDGMTIYEGEARDAYGFLPSEEALVRSAERVDWRRVPPEHLHRRSDALSYLDVAGFRFYTPAIMTTILRGEDERGLLTESFLFRLQRISQACSVRDMPYCKVFNRSQRAAIVRFLKFLVYSSRRDVDCDELHDTLLSIQRCSSPRQS